jgi:hypothetical protein
VSDRSRREGYPAPPLQQHRMSGRAMMVGGGIGAQGGRQDRRGASFVSGCETARADQYQLFSLRSAVNPMGRRLGAGGFISSRMAERIALIASS